MPNNQALPFSQNTERALIRILTDRGAEFCGKPETHDYPLSLALNDIEHTMASGFSELLSIIFSISYSAKDEVIANIVHTIRPFSVARETKQQA